MSHSEGYYVGIAMALLAVVFVALAMNDCSRRAACEDSGGRYVTTHCSTTYVPQMMSCGQNCWYTVLVPVETCEHACVRPVVERAPAPPPAYEPCAEDPFTNCVNNNKGSNN